MSLVAALGLMQRVLEGGAVEQGCRQMRRGRGQCWQMTVTGQLSEYFAQSRAVESCLRRCGVWIMGSTCAGSPGPDSEAAGRGGLDGVPHRCMPTAAAASLPALKITPAQH